MDGRRHNGGARSGSGRKRNNEKYAAPVATFHDQAASDIDARYRALAFLADGGYEEIEEVYEPAGLIMVNKEVITEDGRSVNVKEPAFPHLDPEQLVCVQRKKKIAAPDRAANIYLVDRLAGKPVAAVEVDPDPEGTLEITAGALNEAARGLTAWRQQMNEQLNSQSAPPIVPTSRMNI